MNVQEDNGIQYRGVALHHHPERIKLEKQHREEQRGNQQYNPFAGPFDITIVRTNKKIKFIPDKVMPICLFQVKHEGFRYGYVAGFGSSSFGNRCWTTKDGPNAFKECQEVCYIDPPDRPLSSPEVITIFTNVVRPQIYCSKSQLQNKTNFK